MFKIKYFIAYEVIMTETSEDGEKVSAFDKGGSIIKLPFFSNIETLVVDYCTQVAAAYEVAVEQVGITNIQKLN